MKGRSLTRPFSLLPSGRLKFRWSNCTLDTRSLTLLVVGFFAAQQLFLVNHERSPKVGLITRTTETEAVWIFVYCLHDAQVQSHFLYC